MKRPFEDRYWCLDLNNTAGQFQDFITERRLRRAGRYPRRPVNGEDFDGWAFAEYTPQASAEVQASWSDGRYTKPPTARQPRLVPVDDPESALDAT